MDEVTVMDLPNQEYFFKSSEEMKEAFSDVPEAILNIQEVVDKIESFELARDVLLPKFEIPEEFVNPSRRFGGYKSWGKCLPTSFDI